MEILLMEHADFRFSFHLAVGRYDPANDGYRCKWKLPFQRDWDAETFFVYRVPGGSLYSARELAEKYVRERVMKMLKEHYEDQLL